MPIRDELIERTLQQLASLLAALLEARAGTPDSPSIDLPAAERELEALYRANLGTSRDLVHRLGLEDLIGVLSTAGYVDGERAYLLGALLAVDAEVAVSGGATANEERVTWLRNAALAALLEAGATNLGEPDLDARVRRLMEQVPEETWPLATFERRFRYAFVQGQLSRAEDALFAWLDEVDGPAQRLEVAATADAFYDALETRTDAELEAGDLERDDIALGRADFAARFA